MTLAPHGLDVNSPAGEVSPFREGDAGERVAEDSRHLPIQEISASSR